jgi:hypothetical protein
MLRPGTRLQEYECVENNEDLERYNEMLKDESVFRRNPPASNPPASNQPASK